METPKRTTSEDNRPLWSAAEERADHALAAARDHLDALLRELPTHAQALTIELAAMDAQTAVAGLIFARLRRLRPDLTDLFTIACVPSELPVLEEAGHGR